MITKYVFERLAVSVAGLLSAGRENQRDCGKFWISGQIKAVCLCECSTPLCECRDGKVK